VAGNFRRIKGGGPTNDAAAREALLIARLAGCRCGRLVSEYRYTESARALRSHPIRALCGLATDAIVIAITSPFARPSDRVDTMAGRAAIPMA
jgi:hypothetical protein